jgi:hypothetical protein
LCAKCPSVRRQSTFPVILGDVYPNETLLRHGYIGCSPLQPTLAISVRTLAAYRQSHRSCPRYSIEAQCKMLCNMHNVNQSRSNYLRKKVNIDIQVPYAPYLCTQFSVAYDAYLDICRCVDQQINTALGYNTPTSRLLRSCPCCFYKLQGEPEMEFSSFVSIDGNNSLKHLGTSVRGINDRIDSRTVISDRWLTPEEVDRFKDEVKSRVNGFLSSLPICANFILPDQAIWQ